MEKNFREPKIWKGGSKCPLTSPLPATTPLTLTPGARYASGVLFGSCKFVGVFTVNSRQFIMPLPKVLDAATLHRKRKGYRELAARDAVMAVGERTNERPDSTVEE